jgi:hypothetical protein
MAGPHLNKCYFSVTISMNDEYQDEDRAILNEMIGRFDSPSFIRRARLVETTWLQVLERCAKARHERLTIVGLRLAQLRALAGSWEAIGANANDLPFLIKLFDELQPRLRLRLEATASKRVLRGAALELIESLRFFNERWLRFLAKFDLSAVNRARDEYNRFYLFEKECAVGSARVARIGFKKLEPLTLADVERQFPLLHVPAFRIE